MQSNDAKPALLTRTEVAWLLGEIQVSKLYEYRIRSDIKKKLQVLQEIELPLLKEKGFVSESIVLSANPQNKNLSANPQFENSNNLAPLSKIKQPWPGFGPGTFALPRQRSTRLSYQGKCLQEFNMNLGVH
jgi:hypothetical protein